MDPGRAPHPRGPPPIGTHARATPVPPAGVAPTARRREAEPLEHRRDATRLMLRQEAKRLAPAMRREYRADTKAATSPPSPPLSRWTMRDIAGPDGRILAVGSTPAGRRCTDFFGTAALPVVEQSGHAGTATAIGVMQPSAIGAGDDCCDRGRSRSSRALWRRAARQAAPGAHDGSPTGCDSRARRRGRDRRRSRNLGLRTTDGC